MPQAKRGKGGKEKEEREKESKEGKKEGREKERGREGEEKLSWSLQMGSVLRNSFSAKPGHLQLYVSIHFGLVLSLKISHSESLGCSQLFPKHVSCPVNVWHTWEFFNVLFFQRISLPGFSSQAFSISIFCLECYFFAPGGSGSFICLSVVLRNTLCIATFLS